MSKEIIVKISQDGTPIISVKGVKGKGCREFSRFLEGIGKVIETKDTPEMKGQANEQKQEVYQ
jgi:hypothetical protein